MRAQLARMGTGVRCVGKKDSDRRMTEQDPDTVCEGVAHTGGDETMTERNSSLPGIVRTDGEGTRRDE